MDKIILEHTDDENYEFYGRLADGTPVYKYNPPPPTPKGPTHKEKTQKLIAEYNKSVEIKDNGTSKFLEPFEKEEEKRIEKETRTVIRESKAPPPKENAPDNYGVLDYYKQLNQQKEETSDVETNEYLELFHTQDKEDKIHKEKLEQLNEQRQKKIDAEDARRAESAKKYEDYLQTLNEQELKELRQYELVIKIREEELKREYDTLLIDDSSPDFYTDDAEFKFKTDTNNRAITVTNKSNSATKSFNYLGTLQNCEIKSDRLIVYSVVRDDKEYGVIKEAYQFVTHRHIVYSLRTGKIISRESYVVSKLDPTSVTKEDPDVYAQGPTSRNINLSGDDEYFIVETNNVSDTSVTLNMLDDVIINGESNKIIPTEIFVECYGAGGAGLSGVGTTYGPGGGGGAYASKRITLHPYQEFPLRMRYGVGSGVVAEENVRNGKGTNANIDWSNPEVVVEKDTYFVLENYTDSEGTITQPLTTVAAGGRDGDFNDYYVNGETEPLDLDPGQGGHPFGDYDIGHIGSGHGLWSTVQYYLSGITNSSDWTLYRTAMTTYGTPGNGATPSTHGAGANDPQFWGTLNVGMSSGRSADWDDEQAVSWPGLSPAGGGGGAGHTQDYSGGSHAAYTSGSNGGKGRFSLTITKGIINRQLYS